jgi:Na+/phosphate symporter
MYAIGWGIRLILLPFTLIGQGASKLGSLLFGPLVRRFDTSPRWSQTINSLSSSMATQRGLLLLIGTAIVVISLVVSALAIVLLVAQGHFDRALYWLCLPAALLHLGILLGFTGIMLAVPLGQGYKDR